MKTIVVLALLVAAVYAAPPGADVQILKNENEVGIDSYSFAFATSDGTSRSEKGQLKNAGSENEALSVQGEYEYVGPDGVTYKVTFIADENGFQPLGDHLPKAI